MPIIIGIVLLTVSFMGMIGQYQRAETAIANEKRVLRDVENLQSETLRLAADKVRLEQELNDAKWRASKSEAELLKTKSELANVTEELRRLRVINQELRQVVAQNTILQNKVEQMTVERRAHEWQTMSSVFKSLPLVPVVGSLGGSLFLYGLVKRRRGY